MSLVQIRPRKGYMATNAQIRRIAPTRHSTGRVTAEGKSRVAQNALCTPATSGGRLAPKLLGAGYAVCCLVRSPARLDGRSWTAAAHLETAICGISPDGKFLAVAVNGDISIYNRQRDASTRLTFKPESSHRCICWMPDGKHLVFGQASATPDYSIWWVRSDGSAQPEKLYSSAEQMIPSSISPDGRRIAFARMDPVTSYDIWTLPLDVTDPDHPKAGKPEPFLVEPGIQWDASFSPDGRWMAYSSTQAGPNQIFVRPFPGGPAAGHWQVSNSPGACRFPLWSRNGRELFHISSRTSRIMVAGYTARGDSFAPDKPRERSSTPVLMCGNILSFDLAPDGQRFVALPGAAAEPGDNRSPHITVLLNFFDEQKRKLQCARRRWQARNLGGVSRENDFTEFREDRRLTGSWDHLGGLQTVNFRFARDLSARRIGGHS
jgi:hypothetical protein